MEKLLFQTANGTKCRYGGKIYLHFLFFKKTIYRQTDIYWRDGFYKIPAGFDFEKENRMIKISTETIEVV